MLRNIQKLIQLLIITAWRFIRIQIISTKENYGTKSLTICWIIIHGSQSLDKKWILKMEMKCGWTSKISDCQKVWTTSFWAICKPIQGVGKEISQHLQIKIIEKP